MKFFFKSSQKETSWPVLDWGIIEGSIRAVLRPVYSAIFKKASYILSATIF
jgi:hypothetical protein